MNVERPVRFALIGAAKAVGPYHVGQLLKVQGAEIAALVDPDTAELEKCRPDCPNAGFFASQEEMYTAGVEVDVEIIATPTQLHYRTAIAAMRQGHEVMVEKPLGANVTEAERLLANARVMKRKLHPINQRRLMLPEIVDLVANGALGNDVEVLLRWLCADEEPPFAMRDHRGIFADRGIHHVGLVEALFGSPKPLVVVGHALRAGSPGEFFATAKVEFEGLRASIAVGWQPPGGGGVMPARGEEECSIVIKNIVIEGRQFTLRGLLPTHEGERNDLSEHRPRLYEVINGVEHLVDTLGRPLTVDECRRKEHEEMVRWVREDIQPSMPIDVPAQMRVVDGFYASSDDGGRRQRLA